MSTPQPTFEINVTDSEIHVNGARFALPVALEVLQRVFDVPRRTSKKKHNTIYTWDDHGVRAYSKDKSLVQSLAISLRKNWTYDFIPAALYGGTLRIGGRDYTDLGLQKANAKDDFYSMDIGSHHVFVCLNSADAITEIDISEYQPPPALVDPDRYKLRPAEGEIIDFADFNFKLAVVDILMYDLKLLQPAFDIYEFAERHQARKIDIEEEGYDFIPEVREYFEKLPVEKKYADAITKIIQDGGNEIYGNLIRFWDGEDDVFNIHSFADVDQFKNLKKMILFGDENYVRIKEELAPKGIEVDEG